MASRAKKKPVAAAAAAQEIKEVDGPAATALFAGYAELADLGRENLAAVLRANAALSEGLEAIGREMMSYARSSLENVAGAAAALLAARTFEDVVQLNTEFARASFERTVERSTKLSEMGVKVASETLAPLGSRVEATLHKRGKPLTA